MPRKHSVTVTMAKACRVNGEHAKKGDKVEVTEGEAVYLRAVGDAEPEPKTDDEKKSGSKDSSKKS